MAGFGTQYRPIKPVTAPQPGVGTPPATQPPGPPQIATDFGGPGSTGPDTGGVSLAPPGSTITSTVPPTGQRPGGPVQVGENGDPIFKGPTRLPVTGGRGIPNPTPTVAKPPVTPPIQKTPTIPFTPATPINPAIPKPITPESSPVGANLRGDVYTPGDDPRLQGAQARTDDLMGDVLRTNRSNVQGEQEDRYRSIFGTGNINPNDFGLDTDARFRGIDPNVAGGPAVDAAESARTARYGAAQDAALDGLNGPDRTALAMQKLKDFDAVSNEQRFNEERDLGRNIAKFGRSGMQANADNFGEIQRKIAGDRGRLANELAASVAEGDITDRFRRVDATAGLRGQESGIDAGLRGERRTERDYGTGLAERNLGRATNERDLETALNERNIGRRQSERDTRLGIATGNQDRAFDRSRAAIDAATGQTDRTVNDRYDRLNAATTLEDRVFGQGRSNRDEFRGERGYQNAEAQQTIENRIREREIQQAEEEMRLRRAALQAQAGGL